MSTTGPDLDAVVGASRPDPDAPATVLRDGLAVLRDAGRLLLQHWPVLVVLTLGGMLAREGVLHAALVASRTSGVLSQLVLALAPFVQLVTIVASLLVLRGARAPAEGAGRRRRLLAWGRTVSAVLISAAAILLPFLIIYEHDGALREDVISFALATVEDVQRARYDGDLAHADVTARWPADASLPVIAIVVAALVARRMLDRAVGATPVERGGRRSALRLLAGYCEVVWIMLGVYAVTLLVGQLAGWWDSRALAVSLDTWWAAVRVDLPAVAEVLGSAVAGARLLLAAAITAVVIPLAWLNITAVVYGVQTTGVLSAQDLSGRRVSRVVSRVGNSRTDRALEMITDPERRFGAMIGAAALIARAGWRPVLVFCLAFLVVDNVWILVWEAARVVGPQSLTEWIALQPFLDAAGVLLGRVLTVALVASAVDSILVGLGLPGMLRLGDRQRDGVREPAA